MSVSEPTPTVFPARSAGVLIGESGRAIKPASGFVGVDKPPPAMITNGMPLACASISGYMLILPI